MGRSKVLQVVLDDETLGWLLNLPGADSLSKKAGNVLKMAMMKIPVLETPAMLSTPPATAAHVESPYYDELLEGILERLEKLEQQVVVPDFEKLTKEYRDNTNKNITKLMEHFFTLQDRVVLLEKRVSSEPTSQHT